jgi:hypothetical protein
VGFDTHSARTSLALVLPHNDYTVQSILYLIFPWDVCDEEIS